MKRKTGWMIALCVIFCLSVVTLYKYVPSQLRQMSESADAMSVDAPMGEAEGVLETFEPEYPPKASFGPNPEEAAASGVEAEDSADSGDGAEAADSAADEPVAEQDGAATVDGKAEPVTLVQENDDVRVTATAPVGILPEGVTMQVEELSLPDEKTLAKMDRKEAEALTKRYDEVMSALSQQYAAQKKKVRSAKVYDIRFFDREGQEIEPSDAVQVSMEYKKLDAVDSGDVEVARIDGDDEMEAVDLETDK